MSKMNNKQAKCVFAKATFSTFLVICIIFSGLLMGVQFAIAQVGTSKAQLSEDISFSDVDSSTSHEEDIIWLAEEGISEGWNMPDGTKEFRPYVSIARADLAAFLYRLKGSPEFQPTDEQINRFSDVDKNTSHSKEIWWMVSEGITTGFDDGTFRPYATVVRCDMSAFLYRVAGSPDYEPSDEDVAFFTDITQSTPHSKEIWWMASEGISTGYADKTYRAYTEVARCDMAAFMHRVDSAGFIVASSGETNEEGAASLISPKDLQSYTVTVTIVNSDDEVEGVPQASVRLRSDGTTVKLPEAYNTQDVTVTITDKDGRAVSESEVSLYNSDGTLRGTEVTDAQGKVLFSAASGVTDSKGHTQLYNPKENERYNIDVTYRVDYDGDEEGQMEGAVIAIDANGLVKVNAAPGIPAEAITVAVSRSSGTIVANNRVTINDSTGSLLGSGATNRYGKYTVKIVAGDTDSKGLSTVDVDESTTYTIEVSYVDDKNVNTPVESAHIQLDAAKYITITLPEVTNDHVVNVKVTDGLDNEVEGKGVAINRVDNTNRGFGNTDSHGEIEFKLIDFESEIVVDTSDQEYIGGQVQPSVTSTSLEQGEDFNVAYGKNRNVGENTGTVIVSGTGIYSGEQTYSFNITQAKVVVSGIEANNKVWDGRTRATLIYDNVQIEGKAAGDDLSVTAVGNFVTTEIEDNVTVEITDIELVGIDAGNYVLAEDGQQTQTTASITKRQLDYRKFTVDTEDKIYTGDSIHPEVYVEEGEYEEGTDYEIVYGENKEVGTGTVSINGKGIYESQNVYEFNINKIKVTVSGIAAKGKDYDGTTAAELDYSSVVYAGMLEGDSLSVEAEGTFDDAAAGIEKTVTISNIVLGGADIDHYELAETGQQSTTTARIARKGISSAQIQLGDSLTYNTEVQAQSVSSVVIDGVTLVENVDYMLSDNSQINAGDYTLKVNGIGNYIGFKDQAFSIAKANPEVQKPEGLTADFGQKLNVVELPEGFVWDNADENLNTAYNNEFSTTFTPADTSNYNVVNGVVLTVYVRPIYTVLYHANGASAGAERSDVRVIGDNAQLQPNMFRKTYGEQVYGMKYWTTTEEDTTDTSKQYVDRYQGDLTDTPGSTVHLYAQWTDDDLVPSYWIAAASKTATTISSAVTNPFYTNPESSVIKTAEQIQADIETMKEERKMGIDGAMDSVTSQYRSFMTNDNYHLYTKWLGSTRDTAARTQAANEYVEFRIIQVGGVDTTDDSNLTFQAIHSLPTAFRMNYDATNTTSWGGSDLRAALQPGGSIYKSFNTSLTSVIHTATKTTTKGGGTSGQTSTDVSVSQDSFWLLSHTEITGSQASGYGSEGQQYEYFKNKDIRTSSNSGCLIRKTRAENAPYSSTDGTTEWWERSPLVESDQIFKGVSVNGNPGGNYGANKLLGVVPAFCM